MVHLAVTEGKPLEALQYAERAKARFLLDVLQSGHPAYASAIEELKQSGELGQRCRCRTSPYLNNVIEQDHRLIKKRITASQGFRSAEAAWRTIEGYEAMNAIRKGQIRWIGKGDAVGQRQFIHTIFGIAASTNKKSPLQLRSRGVCNTTPHRPSPTRP